MTDVELYTDGACRGNPGPGGWGVLLRWGAQVRELSGGELYTTNNRMEMTAAIEGLSALRRPCTVALYTDSTYVRSGVVEWLPRWKATGWKTSSRKPVKNDDLWRRLDELAALHRIEWYWIKGHAGHPGNERADSLANQGLDDFLAGRASSRPGRDEEIAE